MNSLTALIIILSSHFALSSSLGTTTRGINRLLQHKVTSTYRAARVDINSCTTSTSVSNGEVNCDTNYVVTAVTCTASSSSSSPCDSIQLTCCKVIKNDNHLHESIVYKVGSTSAISTPSVSRLSPPRVLRQVAHHHFVTGLSCHSTTDLSSCDSLTIHGYALQQEDNDSFYIPDDTSACEWTEFTTTSATCSDSVMTGMDCYGKNCEKIRIQCCLFNTVCPKGTYGDNIVCHECPRGYYGDSAGLTAHHCSGPCRAGTYSTKTGVTSCEETQCPPGSYSTATGATSPTTCKACPAGTYSTSYGASSCNFKCPAGTYNSKEGASSVSDCIECPPSTYSHAPASLSCTECPDGMYIPTTTGESDASGEVRTAKTSIVQCIKCPTGYRNNKAC